MSTFIYTPREYVNTNRIDSVRISNNGNREIVVDGDIIDDNCIGFEETVVSVLPAHGDWECLIPCDEEDFGTSFLSEPVLAWGVTILGSVFPITPSEQEGVDSGYALRRRGESRVYSRDSIGGYESAEEWARRKTRPHIHLVK